jgi:hypothetical protein
VSATSKDAGPPFKANMQAALAAIFPKQMTTGMAKAE